MDKALVISLGGSLIVPNEIDTLFLRSFVRIIKIFSQRNKVVIICGGGHTARKYNSALRSLNLSVSDNELDWMGIGVTYVNALLVRGAFGSAAEKNILQNPTKKIYSSKKVMIGCGWKPGCSTDKDAVLAAKTFGVNTILNLSNISYVYDRDPKKYSGAKPYKTLTWKGFRKIVGSFWKPGAHVPFDPIAAKLAEKWNLKLVIMNGKNLNNIGNFLHNRNFNGTIIG